MIVMTKLGAILKIRLLQNSNARNYFETKERMFLSNILLDLEQEKSEEFTLNENQVDMLQKIYEKYKKFL